jgi:hypothetical protein
VRAWTIVLRFAVVASTMALVGGVIPTGVLAGSGSSSQSLCIGHHPMEYVWYTSSCTGHDEPEIDPLSTRAGRHEI